MGPLLRAKYSYSGGNHHCEEGTRTDILDEIGLWKRDFTKPPIYWLNGLAGTGKTTIAKTVRGSRREGFSAFLFFSEISKENSNRGRVITELAYQLAFRHPEFRSMLILLLGSNPGIVDGLPSDQVKELIVEPLKKSAISTIILIEALDECEDKETVSAILSALKEIVSENKKVKFLITSRPKPHIQEAFLDLAKSRKVTISILHDSSQVNKDIRLFFTNQISKLNCINQIDFPGESVSLSEEQLDELCEAAGGLFVYAVEIARSWYNKHLTHAMILQSLKNIPARKTICSLYTSALVDAFDDCGPEQDQIIRSILGAVVLAETSLSPSTIATLLDLDLEHVLFCLQPVQSLLILQEGSNGLVQPFHKSFPTFLTNPRLCTNERFYVFPPAHHRNLFIGCLKLLNKKLKEVREKPQDGDRNCGVNSQQHVDAALEYACNSWYKHLAAWCS